VWEVLLASIKERKQLLDVVQIREFSQSKVLAGCTTSGAAKFRCLFLSTTNAMTDTSLLCHSRLIQRTGYQAQFPVRAEFPVCSFQKSLVPKTTLDSQVDSRLCIQMNATCISIAQVNEKA
jgi:hypothetical protein